MECVLIDVGYNLSWKKIISWILAVLLHFTRIQEIIKKWIITQRSNTARIQEIILFTTNDSPHQSTHTPKICNKNKTNIPATRWIFYIIHHMSKINTLQCNVLLQFSSIKQWYTHTHTHIYIYIYKHPIHTVTNVWTSTSIHHLP